jgi:hypothetical protein
VILIIANIPLSYVLIYILLHTVEFAMVLLDNPLDKVCGVLKRTGCSGR